MKNISNIQTIADIVRVNARARPAQTAIFYNGKTTSYAELDSRSNQVANGLLGENPTRQSRVTILDKNSDTYFEILFGSAKANMVLAVLNWRLFASEIAYLIDDAKTELLFVGPEFFDLIAGIRDELKTVKKIIAVSGEHSEWETYISWRDGQSADESGASAGGDDDVVLQMYTSGTTGNPKGVQLTNASLLAFIAPCAREYVGYNDRDVSSVFLPVFHLVGTGLGLATFYAGGKNVVLRDTVPAEILRLIAEQRITVAVFVPALILFLLQTPGIAETDLSSLRLIVYGASPIPVELLRKAKKTFKCRFAQGYGLTESSAAFAYLSPEDHDSDNEQRLRSCGTIVSSAEVRVVDEQDNELPVGEVGEVIVRSPQNMKGYWNLPEETAQTIRGEWLYTGDAGYFDADGYLYIHDRVKDMIISGGENIYPAEIESALFGHPAVADVAVIGVPDDEWGEAVKAIVVKKSGVEVADTEIISFAQERIARFKAPKSVDFVDALPRNPTGKILKRQLREPYWQGRERRVN